TETATITPIAPTATNTATVTQTPTSTPAVATATSTATATRTPTKTPVATSTPKPVAPAISLDKIKSKFNGWVKADLAGFTPGDQVKLTWPNGDVLASGTADSQGTLQTGFRTPLDPLGDYKVSAADQHGRKASTTLRVIPRILIGTDDFGAVGDIYRVYFYGFAPGDQVEVRWYAADGVTYQVVATVEVASNGRGVTTRLYVPQGSTVGDHWVVGKVVGVARSTSTYFTVIPGTTALVPVEQAIPDMSAGAMPEARFWVHSIDQY
ncbi:MAG TPA: hypothetical protein PK691_11720, partial [Thermomicrobiales bacterium]|nr:hypothetical protein [Thermomicrobiales bacterium]